jgi:hypothetical protein
MYVRMLNILHLQEFPMSSNNLSPVFFVDHLNKLSAKSPFFRSLVLLQPPERTLSD